MPRLHETIDTALPIDDAFAFVADFANAQPLGSGRRDLRAARSPAPSALGARYRARASGCAAGSTPMEYRITTFEPADAGSS